MAVNMKLGVDLGSFNSGINQAKTQLRTFDAALKNAEAAFKATGDAESAMATKMTALNGKFQTQKKMVEDYRKVLEDMVKNGVDQTGAAYQKMQKDMLLAEAAMYDTQTAIDALNGSQEKAAGSADKLSTSVSNIGKKMSLDQVISGINSITGGLEKAAGVALRLGEHIFDNIMTSAQWGDDIATQAMMAQMSVEDYQRVVNVAATQGETSVNSLIKSWKKLKTNMAGDSKEVAEALDELGVSMYENVGGKYGNAGPLRDYMDIYWEIGEALMAMGEGADQERYAQTLLGRSWQESIPMFRLGREEYEKLIAAQDVVSAESVNNLGVLNETVIGLEQQFNTLKNEVIAQFAPALTEVGGVVSGLLSELNAYLQTDDGKQMLTDLGTAVSGLFENLKNIDPQEVISGFTGVFNTVIDSLKWLDENKDTVVKALEYIVKGWAVLKLTGGALDILKLINGIHGLTGAGGAGIGTGGGGLLGGAGGKLLATGAGVGLTGTAAAIGSALTMFDPTGLTALIPSVLEDQTAFLRTLRNGGSLEEAAAESGKAVEQAFEGAKKSWADWFDDIINVPKELAKSVYKDLFGGSGDEPTAEVKVEPKTDEEAAAMISAQIGTVSVPVKLVIQGGNGSSGPSFGGGASGGGGLKDYYWETVWGGFRPGFANGLPYVPQDGIYMLHKGETVNPSREVTSRNYSSNLYVEKMIMNNGTDAQGLAERMAAEQQRTMSGFGS